MTYTPKEEQDFLETPWESCMNNQFPGWIKLQPGETIQDGDIGGHPEATSAERMLDIKTHFPGLIGWTVPNSGNAIYLRPCQN
jgi:hypothetical protein